MSDAVSALGAVITINGTPVEEARDIAGLDLSTDTVEVTNHSSPGSGEEFLPTIKRWGEVTFPMNAVPGATGQQALYDAWNDRSADTYVITYTNGVEATFTGYCTFGLAAVAGVNEVNVTIRPASQPDLSWGS